MAGHGTQFGRFGEAASPELELMQTAIVTLTALGSADGPRTRTIKLSRDKPVVSIGRASKTESKGIEAAADNAWLDSPVVSRVHAELRLVISGGRQSSQSDSARPSTPGTSIRLVLIDLGSMHGTYINDSKLRIPAGDEVTLQNDTILTFGTEVSRNAVVFTPQRFSVSFFFTPSFPLTPESRSPLQTNKPESKIFGYGITEDDLYIRSDLGSDSGDEDYGVNDYPDSDEVESEGNSSEISEEAEEGDELDFDDEEEEDESPAAFDKAGESELLILDKEDVFPLYAWATSPVNQPAFTDKNVIVIDDEEPTSGQKLPAMPPRSTVDAMSKPDISFDADPTKASVDQTRSRVTITDILNSVPAESQSPARKRKFADISTGDVPEVSDRYGSQPEDEDSLPDAQPRELPADSSLSSITSAPPTPAQRATTDRPAKKAKTTSSGGFVRTATAALIGVAVGAVGVFAALAASAPADM